MITECKVGDKLDLDWIKGCGHAKVVAVYQNYAMVIHPAFNSPFVFPFSRLERIEETSPKPTEEEVNILKKEDVVNAVVEDIENSGRIRQAIQKI